MSDFSIEQTMELAISRRQAGNLQEAESLCRQVLDHAPNHPDALHISGLLAWQLGRKEPAAELLRQAIATDPKRAEFYQNLALMLAHRGEDDAAIDVWRQATQADARSADAFFNFAKALQSRQRWTEAIAAYRQAIVLRPMFAEACNNLGNTLYSSGNLLEAISTYRRAIVLQPDSGPAHFNLGNALREEGKLDEAISLYKTVNQLQPRYVPAYTALGLSLRARGETQEAVTSFQTAADLSPEDAEIHHNLANALRAIGKYDDAIVHYRKTIELRPELAEPHLNLGGAYKEIALIDQAVDCYDHFLAARPNAPAAASHRLYIQHLRSGYDPSAVFEQHKQWNRQFAQGLNSNTVPFENDRSPERRLRIGYVSPDFHLHPVSFFFQSLLQAHDAKQVEAYCYADIPKPDEVTERLRKISHQWRNITGQSDSQVAKLIRYDKIDILVDLAGHTYGNRLLAFARKPAPIQITYLGYPDTTGLETMDYRLTDAVADPMPMTEKFHTEKLLRLPGTFLCAAGLDPALPITPLPSLATGFVTFASFNALSKITDEMVDRWARILSQIPRSRIMIKSHAGLDNQSPRQRIFRIFANHGVDSQRVDVLGRFPEMSRHLELYQQVDIALDTFPYNGTTITCEALWMGVPVITLAGNAHVSRVGASLASCVGLTDFIAQEAEKYMAIAVEWANRREELAQIRASLRDKMKNSTLGDGARFARNVETAYRQIWHDWLAG